MTRLEAATKAFVLYFETKYPQYTLHPDVDRDRAMQAALDAADAWIRDAEAALSASSIMKGPGYIPEPTLAPLDLGTGLPKDWHPIIKHIVTNPDAIYSQTEFKHSISEYGECTRAPERNVYVGYDRSKHVAVAVQTALAADGSGMIAGRIVTDVSWHSRYYVATDAT